MARGGMWAVWFGKGLAPVALTPIAIFVTYKANKDSMVFNADLYKEFFMRLLGLRLKRHVFAKEVIINDPDYANDTIVLKQMNADIDAYSKEHRLVSAPNIIDVFFKYKKDNEIERISEVLESVIEDLANTKDKILLHEMNKYPILATKAHTRPFEHKWLNIIAGVLVPVGAVLYIRMWTFRLRLYRDLRQIRQTNQAIIVRMREFK
jgi:lipopolysaccharide export system permease protein